MNRKSYLADQILLMSLTSFDFFDDEEVEEYETVISCINEYEKLKAEKTKDKNVLNEIVARKKEHQKRLNELVSRYDDVPRNVNVRLITDLKLTNDEVPEGISWNTVKLTKKIAEFCSEESRCLGLNPGDVTLDKIIIKWKNEDILRQIVINGFYLSILEGETVTTKHYSFMTASAGQLRTDKIQCISDDAWERIKNPLQCGLNWDVINAKGGINSNKYLAYMSLPCSATEVWNIDIDRFIVIDDFEGPVTGVMDVINTDYTVSRELRTIMINHVDGSGIMLPKASMNEFGTYDYGMNWMVRGPYIKGLLSTFDFLKFCEVNKVPAVIKDIYGTEHDLIKEDIQVMLTKSQFKLWKYYDNWDQFKEKFRECGCHICRTNYEEEYIDDTEICYQMLQSCVDFTDEEIKQFTFEHKQKIENISINKYNMLRVLGADRRSNVAYNRCLAIYNSLLRDEYAKSTLKSIKKRWIYDGKSGAIKCRNKRLYVLPDFYAACEYWFMGIAEPEGILHGDEVASKLYYDMGNVNEIAPLRSPHLSFEWMICPLNKDPEVYKWFQTNGIYTSCHSLISRVDQFK